MKIQIEVVARLRNFPEIVKERYGIVPQEIAKSKFYTVYLFEIEVLPYDNDNFFLEQLLEEQEIVDYAYSVNDASEEEKALETLNGIWMTIRNVVPGDQVSRTEMVKQNADRMDVSFQWFKDHKIIVNFNADTNLFFIWKREEN